MQTVFLSQEKSSVILIDPRTKIYMLVVFNIIMLTSITEGVAVYLKPALAFLSFLALLNARKSKIAIIYGILYVICYYGEILLNIISGVSVLGFLVRFFIHITTRMVPGMMFAYYIISTTKVSEFIASMEKMHISQKVIIPFAIMFRFFPTISEEYRSIKDAMRLRNIGFKKGPTAMLEYRLVPLIISIVKIGDELSAASITRGLGSPTVRTNYCQIGFRVWDILFILLITGILAIYMIL